VFRSCLAEMFFWVMVPRHWMIGS